ncbi:MAG: hypothetical protein IRZ13_05670 [Acetobacteraceae bacterium]|nr:hypothetical protein [Acetobacteraceae bacterium]
MGVSMSSAFLALLRTEERQLLAELRATPIFQKLEAVRRVLSLYTGADEAAAAATEDLLLGRASAAAKPAEPPLTRDPGPPVASNAATEAEEARSAGASAAPLPFAADPGPGTSRLSQTTSAPPLATPVPALGPAATPAKVSGGTPALSQLTVADPPGEKVFRDGSRAVSAVRAALLAVTR